MAPARHLVVMVKAPRLGAVKRRLAHDVGTVAAWRFYRQTAQSLIARLGRDRRWRLWLAVTPDRYVPQGRHSPPGVRRIGQGSGDLGTRMARLLRHPAPGPVLVVGSDIPELAPAHIARAFRALGTHDLVFGPARDGGYWLVGVRRRPLPPDLFRGVRWSTPHALEDTLANVGPRFSVAMADTLDDVDTGADFARSRARNVVYTSAPLGRKS